MYALKLCDLIVCHCRRCLYLAVSGLSAICTYTFMCVNTWQEQSDVYTQALLFDYAIVEDERTGNEDSDNADGDGSDMEDEDLDDDILFELADF